MRRWLAWALGLAGLAAACDKPDAPAAAQDPAATSTASPAGDGGEDGAASPTRDAAAASAPPSSPPPPAPRAPIDGGPTIAEAPLAYWMRDHTATALREKDLFALAAAFDQLALLAPKTPPPAYANWASIAKDGASAARAASLEGVKGACRGCHAQYRDAYRATMRARPLS